MCIKNEKNNQSLERLGNLPQIVQLVTVTESEFKTK